MLSLFWWILWLAGLTTLAYHKTNNSVTNSSIIAGFLVTLLFSPLGVIQLILLFVLLSAILAFINLADQRRLRITLPCLIWFQKHLPKMSATENVALQAGTVGWDGELFSGNPNWSKWWKMPVPKVSAEEQAFLDGPVETLCLMINDWEITHVNYDLSPEVWDFLKQQRFFAIIIPKKFGGLGFSALAHSEILAKIASCSLTVASTVAVPNSLGPAELIHQYGTPEQQAYYLPRLARGLEIPCFALTNKEAGSDATAIPDKGVICRDLFEGKEVLGIRLNWDKRYITLAPIATLLGLAFKLYDPDHLLGSETKLGITCALVPTNLPGITIGNRHRPLATPFQNGPTTGIDVFIPIEWIIGGPKMAGQGWRMLVECLSTGRAISLPSSAVGASKMLTAATTAYARLRRQFKQPIGHFGGIEEVLARMAANTYVINALRLTIAGCIDQQESPAVLGAISKCYVTAKYRSVSIDAMDVHGGKGIMQGPKNYTANPFMGTPISITVEGANILTRSMIIFGQGVMRSHPYILKEIQAAQLSDENQSLLAFDQALISHIAYSLSNAARAFFMGLSQWKHSKSYLPEINRASAAFAFTADLCMLLLGGKLKVKEKLSGRFSDMLAMMTMASCTLKHYADQGSPAEDQPLIDWAMQDTLSYFWAQMDTLLQNFPNRVLGLVVRFIVMPLGKHVTKPSDALTHKVVNLLLSPSATRTRLTQGIYLNLSDKNKPHCVVEKAFLEVNDAEKPGASQEVINAAETLRQTILEVDQFTATEF